MRPKGNALIITIMVSLVLVISVMGITTSLTVSNRQTSSNQGLANRAQYAAESGLARGVQNLTQVRDDLNLAQLNLTTGITSQSQLDAAMETLRQQMYAFCYGTQDGDDPALSGFTITPTGVPAQGQFLCAQSQVDGIDRSADPATVGNSRMGLIKDNIPLTAYGANRFANDAAESAYWGRIAQGTLNDPIVLGQSNGLTDRVQVQLDLRPFNIVIQANGSYQILLGDPSRGIVATGEVLRGSDVVATRTIAQAVAGNTNPMTVQMSAPSFARFGWFYNSHRRSADPSSPDYNSATLITNSLRVNGPAFTNGRFVFANNARPQFQSEFGSAGCENGVQMTGNPPTPTCLNKQRQYHVGGVGSGSSRTPTNDTTWSNLLGIAPTFAIKRDALGRELCLVNGAETPCAPGAPDSQKVRDVNWNRSTIPMPTTAADTFLDRASNGGLLINGNANDYSAPWSGGGRYFTSFNNICFGGTAPNSGQPCATLPTDMQSRIGTYEGRPTVTLNIDPTTGLQRIRVSANITKGYQPSLSPDCGGGGGPGGGGGGSLGTDAPFLQRIWADVSPKLHELSQAIGTALTFGSVAMAQNTGFSSSWRCTWGSRNGQAPLGWWVEWVQDEGNGNRVRFDNVNGVVRPVNSGGTWNNDTQGQVVMEYEVDSSGRIRVVDDNRSSHGSTQTWPTNMTGREPPLLVQAPTTSTAFGTATFNGVVYRNGTQSGNQWSHGNLIVEGGNGADIASYQQVTVAARQSIFNTTDITYQTNPVGTTGNNRPRNLLGLYAVEDVMISDWDRGTSSTSGRTLNAVLMSQNGSIRAGGMDWEGNNGRNVNACNFATKGNLNVTGSLIQNTLGAINCTNNGAISGGYTGNYTYDDRMMQGFAPPAFPSFGAGNWGFQAVLNVNTNQRGFWQVVPSNN